MKINNHLFRRTLLAVMALASCFALQSCKDEPDKYESTDGVPTIYYIRPADINQKDSLLVSAYPQMTIALIGDNLRSIKEMYFNDLPAVLNSSYMTDHTLIVNVPKDIPGTVNDKITMITADGQTVYYDFHVIIPAPTIATFSNEWAAPGQEVTLYGNYFVDDPNVPIAVNFPGDITVTDFTSKSLSALTFLMPNCTEEGEISVTSIYGTTKATFHYRESRGMILDWDGTRGGLALANGWRQGDKIKVNDGTGIDGAFVRFTGALTADGWSTSEDAWCFNYWADGTATAIKDMESCKDLFAKYDISQLGIKFECRVPASMPWQSTALQVMLTKEGQSGTNSYYWDETFPRALWSGYASSGSYDTGGEWTTITIPLTSFTKTHTGEICKTDFSADYLGGLTFYFMGGPEGVAGTLQMDVDNIRIAPTE